MLAHEQLNASELERRFMVFRFIADYNQAQLLALAANYLYCAGFLDAGGGDAAKREEIEFNTRRVAFLFLSRIEGWRRLCESVHIPAASVTRSQPGERTIQLVLARIETGPPPFTEEQIRSRNLLPQGEPFMTPEAVRVELMQLFLNMIND